MAAKKKPPENGGRKPTSFEEEVYAAVRTIPKGEVRTYQWVAERIGKPGAARAVGNALHRNPYAPEVPCHRVVRCDGSLGGFAGGPDAKRRLLAGEGFLVSDGRRATGLASDT